MALMLSSKTWRDAGDLIAANDRTFVPAVEPLRQAAGSGDITAADADTVDMAAVLALLHRLAFVAGHGPTGTKPTSDLVARRRGQGPGRGNPPALTSGSGGQHRKAGEMVRKPAVA
ncbi:hypothetical protein [Streptomyces sp. NPDC049970]|uniref:hypothetical protein n=1 Tax=Streptomyces sp. NPDC049970 TaxID=3155033 RepID=UPI00342F23BC